MLILIHSETNANTVRDNLGKPEYSYYFVLKEYRPVLEQIGTVIEVANPDQEVDALYDQARAEGTPCIFLSFSPPHRTPVHYRCPTVPVFAWEFDTLPYESWYQEPRHNWGYVLEKLKGAITHSSFTVESVKRMMGDDYLVASLPAPVWDRFSVRAKAEPPKATQLWVDGLVVDSRTLDVQAYAPKKYRTGQQIDLKAARCKQQLSLDGVVYSSVFNPFDGRKNWVDMLGVFCWCFRETSDATLVLKLTHHLVDEALESMLHHLYKLQPYQCRVVIIHGFLDDDDYERLVDATHYVVNTSYGEGQCLPLMEFMSCAKPALAPANTAMLDYINPQNSFVIDCTSELTAWPHDPRAAYRTLRYIPVWDSVFAAYEQSYQVAKYDLDRYQSMAQQARVSLQNFCSQALIKERLSAFIDARLALEPSDVVPPLQEDFTTNNAMWCGLRDISLDGWYLEDSGELLKGFAIRPEDQVLDVGCGGGSATLFAARQGAHVVFTDVVPDKVQALSEQVAQSPARAYQGIVSDSNPLPIESGWASRVMCLEVLEHVPDPAQIMAELVRVGQPGALYLISVPSPLGEHLQKGIASPDYYQAPNHIRIFTDEAFAELITSAGLVIEHRQASGFFWVMNMIFFWANQKLKARGVETVRDEIEDNHSPLMLDWAQTWKRMLARPEGLALKHELDQFMPKSQVILARKP